MRLVFFLALVVLASVASGCAADRTVTLLFTNDFESAYDPTPAFWRDDMESIGGVAQLATLIENQRKEHETVFLFDAGDIFTGTLAQLTRGEIAFELMNTMGYDAMGIGNHEFEFGWQEFARQKQRASFPVLGANLTYKTAKEADDNFHNSFHNNFHNNAYAEPYTIIERNGVRIGVIGVMGQDAATALIPSNLAGVAVSDPIAAVKNYVELLRERCNLIVVLAHQGPTAPMQTNDEADPEVYRGNAENLALAAAVPGIDVIFAGHTDAGTPEALRDPVNGTLIMQTWGQGQHLGLLQLTLSNDAVSPTVTLVRSELIPVDSAALKPDAEVAATLAEYRVLHSEIFTEIGAIERIASRQYYRESTLGNLLADIVREQAQTEIGLMPGGALRKDLPQGVLRRVDLLDMFPFKDRVAVVELRGETLAQIVEQGLSLERGLLQVSGLEVRYDPAEPPGSRLIELHAGGKPVEPERIYRVATLEILAQGGDSYVQFRDALSSTLSDDEFSQELVNFFANRKRSGAPVKVPSIGRYSLIH